MFAKATSKFVSEIDPEGHLLIPVSHLSEVDNLNLLSLVIKRSRFWFWQQPKYLPLDFTLNDILLGEDIDPGFVETDFLKYSSTLKNDTTGGAEASLGPGNLNVRGKGSSKLASSFGKLQKQEVDLQKLLDNCKGRVLDPQHTLVKQAREKKREVIAVVKECIFTTQPCTISEEVHVGASCGAFLGFTAPKKISVSLKDSSHHSESNVSVEIPAKTPLAYGLIELHVKSTGHFELCLLSDTCGGFELDGPEHKSVGQLHTTPPEAPNKDLQRELDKLQSQFNLLSGLPASTCSSLLQQITLLLKDKMAISALDHALKDLCSDGKPDLSTLDKVPSLKAAVQTILELLQDSKSDDDAPLESTSSEEQLQPTALTATHVLTSALEDMTDSTLLLLESCSCPTTLQAMHCLVQNMVKNGSLGDSSLSVLAEEDTYNKIKELFGSSNITLCKKVDSVCAEVSGQDGYNPLLLCIAISGLASLVTPL